MFIDRIACWWLDWRQAQSIEATRRAHPEVFHEMGVKKLEVGDFGFELVLHHPDVYLMCDELASLLNEAKAENYLQFDLWPRLDRASYPIRVTVQWAHGMSPAAKNATLLAACEEAFTVLDAELDEYGDEDGPPPTEVLRVHTLLYKLLGKAPAPETDDDGADLPL